MNFQSFGQTVKGHSRDLDGKSKGKTEQARKVRAKLVGRNQLGVKMQLFLFFESANTHPIWIGQRCARGRQGLAESGAALPRRQRRARALQDAACSLDRGQQAAKSSRGKAGGQNQQLGAAGPDGTAGGDGNGLDSSRRWRPSKPAGGGGLNREMGAEPGKLANPVGAEKRTAKNDQRRAEAGRGGRNRTAADEDKVG